jgi:hypothetical protein
MKAMAATSLPGVSGEASSASRSRGIYTRTSSPYGKKSNSLEYINKTSSIEDNVKVVDTEEEA